MTLADPLMSMLSVLLWRWKPRLARLPLAQLTLELVGILGQLFIIKQSKIDLSQTALDLCRHYLRVLVGLLALRVSFGRHFYN